MKKESNRTKSPASRNWRQKIAGLGIILIAFLIIFVLASFLWQKLFFREQVARFLPYDRTVGFLEFNFDPNHPDSEILKSILEKSPLMNGLKVEENLFSLIPQQELFWKWFGGRGGLALITSANGQSISPVLILKSQDETNLRSWLKSQQLNSNLEQLLEEDYYGQKLITLHSGPGYSVLLSDGYVVLSENQELLQAVAEAKAGHTVSLAGHPEYGQVYSALPQQNLAFIYFNIHNTLSTLTHTPAYLSRNLAGFQLYLPFLKLFKAYGLALYLDKDHQNQPVFTAKELILFGDKPDANLFKIDYSFDGSLTAFLPQYNQTIALFGGVNLLDQKNQLSAFLKNQTIIYDLLFTGTLSQIRDQLFDNSVNFDQDFLPLFQGQYLISINQASPDAEPIYSLVLESKNPQADQLKLTVLLEKIGTKIAANLNAQKAKITLPDKTEGQEIKAESFAISNSTISLNGKSVTQIALAPNFSIYLATLEQHIIVSTNADWLKAALDNAAQTSQSTSINDWNQTDLVKPTEYYQFFLPALQQWLPAIEYLQPFNRLEVTKKFTEIGTLAVYRFTIQ
ncbi:DUF3352 domain-containing protein [Candidatus Peregrinibacteria bacterium]|nr:DUF3352 domain-containing protein [Candidatus Peregrinibacteria bacterium]